MSLARASASMRWTNERSGAAVGLEGDSVTGGMGGDYTSWEGAIKTNKPNSTRPQAELEHCRGWFGELPKFAGGFATRCKMVTSGVADRSTPPRGAFTDRLHGAICEKCRDLRGDPQTGRRVAEAFGPDRHQAGAGAQEIEGVCTALNAAHAHDRDLHRLRHRVDLDQRDRADGRPRHA